MKPKPRLALQLTIIGTTLWIMAGCFYLPTPKKTLDDALLPADAIGQPDSDKPLRLHQSTADDVRRVLDRHVVFSPDNRYALYTYTIHTGYTVWPLCFYAQPDTQVKYVQLRFTPDGHLTSFTPFNDWDSATRDTGIQPPYFNRLARFPTSTPSLTPEQEQLVRQRLAARRQSETRPTTTPTQVP